MKYKYVYLFFFSYLGSLYPSLSLDLIIFSFDRPMQLYALLESIMVRLSGISNITVIYRADDNNFEHAYQTTMHDFPTITFKRHIGKSDFQKITTDIIQQSQSTHIFFGVDDIIVTDECDLQECLYAFENSNAYTFALRLGRNITYCYTCDFATPPPSFHFLTDSIFSFQYAESTGDWDYTNSLDMNIYKRSTVLEFINRNLAWCHPNRMEGEWSIIAPKTVPGLCFATSKIVNIPINVVNVDWESRNMKSYTKYELLEMFNEGRRINIDCLHKYLPRAPHEEINLNFK